MLLLLDLQVDIGRTRLLSTELRELGTKLEQEILEEAAKHKPDTTPHTHPPPPKPLLPSLSPRPPPGW